MFEEYEDGSDLDSQQNTQIESRNTFYLQHRIQRHRRREKSPTKKKYAVTTIAAAAAAAPSSAASAATE